MAAIKKFFEKRKLDIKFKRAGEGHSLKSDGSASVSVESSATSLSPPSSKSPLRAPPVLSVEQKMAADAALARINQQKTGSSGANKSSGIKSLARLEIDAEKRAHENAMATASRDAGPLEVELNAAPVAGKVLFRCPMINPELRLPKEEMEAEIESFLLSQLTEEPSMSSALMMYTLNRNDGAVKQCVETIEKYLENIATHPAEDKYQRIRVANKVLQEKVLSVRGAEEFLQAAGFKKSPLVGSDGNSDEYLVFDASDGPEAVSKRCTDLKDILNSAERIKPELDRDVRVFCASANAARIVVPDEFYRVTPEELKREQQARTEAVEQFGMLRTRQMRERDRIKELRRYRYCLIRIRFPDGVLLQGTFSASDKLSVVSGFIVEYLANDWIPFLLSKSTGERLDCGDLTLAELDLAPASLVNFAFDADLLADITINAAAANQEIGGVNISGPFLQPQLMASITSL